ncbi:MAG: anthranilate phosphoribosyltransferase, partial [Verrucomicrobiota bacterium]
MLAELTARLAAVPELAPDQITRAVELLTEETVGVEEKAEFLAALARRGETAAEIAGLAGELLARATPLPVPPSLRAGDILDVCGTGGDRLGTFNISTTVALVCAAAGVVVAKHGNRAITSRSGSADVLEALGVPVDLSPAEAAASLERHGF